MVENISAFHSYIPHLMVFTNLGYCTVLILYIAFLYSIILFLGIRFAEVQIDGRPVARGDYLFFRATKLSNLLVRMVDQASRLNH